MALEAQLMVVPVDRPLHWNNHHHPDIREHHRHEAAAATGVTLGSTPGDRAKV